MAFGIASYEQNMAGVNGTDQVRDRVSAVSSVKAANAAALGDAREGAVVTGEVVGIKGRTVQLRLPDSQIVTARLEADVKIQAGQSMAFAVKSNTGTQIALTPLFNSTAVNPTAIKALGQASILVNQETLSMASAMMEEGLPIDKNSMQSMFHMVNRFENANPADIVSMMKQGIPVNSDNIEQFAIYRNNEHQIMGMVDSISEALADDVTSLPLEGAVEVAEIFNGEAAGEADTELRDGLLYKEGEFEQQLLKEQNTVRTEQEEVTVKPAGILDVLRQKEALEATKQTETEALTTEKPAVREMIAEDADTELGRLLEPKARENIARVLNRMGVRESTTDSILDGSAKPEKVLAFIQKSAEIIKDGTLESLNLDSAEKSDIERDIRSMVSGDIMRRLIKHAVRNEFTLKPDGDISQEKIQQLYQKMVAQSERALSVLENYSKADEGLSKGVESLKQNISFMNQLNETFTYVQLPIQLSGENAHGDLYVYTNKKKLMEKDGEVSALLHLEMEAMGTVDINVHLKDSNKVSMDWTLPNEEIINLVEANLPMLNKRLSDRGYEVKCQVGLREDEDKDKNKAVTAMLGAKKVPSKGLMSKFSFDVKA